MAAIAATIELFPTPPFWLATNTHRASRGSLGAIVAGLVCAVITDAIAFHVSGRICDARSQLILRG